MLLVLQKEILKATAFENNMTVTKKTVTIQQLNMSTADSKNVIHFPLIITSHCCFLQCYVFLKSKAALSARLQRLHLPWLGTPFLTVMYKLVVVLGGIKV